MPREGTSPSAATHAARPPPAGGVRVPNARLSGTASLDGSIQHANTLRPPRNVRVGSFNDPLDESSFDDDDDDDDDNNNNDDGDDDDDDDDDGEVNNSTVQYGQSLVSDTASGTGSSSLPRDRGVRHVSTGDHRGSNRKKLAGSVGSLGSIEDVEGAPSRLDLPRDSDVLLSASFGSSYDDDAYDDEPRYRSRHSPHGGRRTSGMRNRDRSRRSSSQHSSQHSPALPTASSYTKNDDYTPTGPNYIDRLSDDVLLSIFAYLDPVQLGQIRHVSTRWMVLASSEECWKLSFIHYFGIPHALSGSSLYQNLISNEMDIHKFSDSDGVASIPYEGFTLTPKINGSLSWLDELRAQRSLSRGYRKTQNTAITSDVDEGAHGFDQLFIFGLGTYANDTFTQDLIRDNDILSKFDIPFDVKHGSRDRRDGHPCFPPALSTSQREEEKLPWAVLIDFEQGKYVLFDPFTKKKAVSRFLTKANPIPRVTAIKKIDHGPETNNPLILSGFADGTASMTVYFGHFNYATVVDFIACHQKGSSIQQVAFINNMTNHGVAITAASDGLIFLYETKGGSPIAVLDSSLSDVFGVPSEYANRCFMGDFVSLETIDYDLEKDGKIICATTVVAVKSTGIILRWTIEELTYPVPAVGPLVSLEDYRRLPLIKKSWVGSLRRVFNTVSERGLNTEYESTPNTPFMKSPNSDSGLSRPPGSPYNLPSNSYELFADELPELATFRTFNYSSGFSNNVLSLVNSHVAHIVTANRIYLVHFDNWFEFGVANVANNENIKLAEQHGQIIIGGVLALIAPITKQQAITCCSWGITRRHVSINSIDGAHNSKRMRELLYSSAVSDQPSILSYGRSSSNTLVTGHINGTFTVWELPNGTPGLSLSTSDRTSLIRLQDILSKFSNRVKSSLNVKDSSSKDYYWDNYGLQYQILCDFKYIRPRMVSSHAVMVARTLAVDTNDIIAAAGSSEENIRLLARSFEDKTALFPPQRKQQAFLSKSYFYQNCPYNTIVYREHNAISLMETLCSNTSPVVSCFVDDFKLVVSHLDGYVSVLRLVDGLLLSRMAKSGKQYRSANAFNANVDINGNLDLAAFRNRDGLHNVDVPVPWDENNSLGPWATSPSLLTVLHSMTSIPVPMRFISADQMSVFGLRESSAVRVRFGRDMTKSAKRLIAIKNRRTSSKSQPSSTPQSPSTTTPFIIGESTGLIDPSSQPVSSAASDQIAPPPRSLLTSALGGTLDTNTSRMNINPSRTSQFPGMRQHSLIGDDIYYTGSGNGRSLGNARSGSAGGGSGSSSAQDAQVYREMKYSIKQELRNRDLEGFEESEYEKQANKFVRAYNGRNFADGTAKMSEEELIQYVAMLSLQDSQGSNSADMVSETDNASSLTQQGTDIHNDKSTETSESNLRKSSPNPGALDFYINQQRELQQKMEEERRQLIALAHDNESKRPTISTDETNFPTLDSVLAKKVETKKNRSPSPSKNQGSCISPNVDEVSNGESTKKGKKKGKKEFMDVDFVEWRRNKDEELDRELTSPTDVSRKEQEDLDRAIAMSLLEEENARAANT